MARPQERKMRTAQHGRVRIPAVYAEALLEIGIDRSLCRVAPLHELHELGARDLNDLRQWRILRQQ